MTSGQLVSYIAPAAPATRRSATGDEPSMRPEVGFTPSWYRQHLDVDFGRRWHTDPAYRHEKLVAMRRLLDERFPDVSIGRVGPAGEPIDLLTGTFGACSVAAIYGIPIVYANDQWPTCADRYLSDQDVDRLQPPDLDTNPFFRQLSEQVDWIAGRLGRVVGFINWQGVLNNAQRLRGQQLFLDLIDRPDRARHLFECVCTTMIDAARRLHARQRETGVQVDFFTVSNCLVNLISPVQYTDLLLSFDIRMADAFRCLGIHNCAWNANPYLEAYASVPNVAYIDMGQTSDLLRARELFPAARRAVMVTPMDLAGKDLDTLGAEFRRIAREFAPCDVVLADIEAGTPDQRVRAAIDWCRQLSGSIDR